MSDPVPQSPEQLQAQIEALKQQLEQLTRAQATLSGGVAEHLEAAVEQILRAAHILEAEVRSSGGR